jgi:hypothetical protein
MSLQRLEREADRSLASGAKVDNARTCVPTWWPDHSTVYLQLRLFSLVSEATELGNRWSAFPSKLSGVNMKCGLLQ